MEYGLSFGTNQGDALGHLIDGGRRVAAIPGIVCTARSRIYETDPVDVQQQYRDVMFLNSVMIVEGRLSPEELSECLHVIEADMGRVRTADRNAPRTIDIDIIYAGNLRIDTPRLTIPHHRWSERRFVVEPLCDVRPELVLPGAEKTVRDILNSLPPLPAARALDESW